MGSDFEFELSQVFNDSFKKSGKQRQMHILGSDCQLKGILLDICVLLYWGFLNNCGSLLPPSVDHQHRVLRVLLVLPAVPVAVVEQMEPGENKTMYLSCF